MPGHAVTTLWVLCQRLWEGSWIHSALGFQKEDKQVEDHFGVLVAINILVQIIANNGSMSHSACKVPPRKPKKGSRLPKKGKLVQNKFVLNTWGTIRLLPRRSERKFQSFPSLAYDVKVVIRCFWLHCECQPEFPQRSRNPGLPDMFYLFSPNTESGGATIEPARTLLHRFTGGTPMEELVKNTVLRRDV